MSEANFLLNPYSLPFIQNQTKSDQLYNFIWIILIIQGLLICVLGHVMDFYLDGNFVTLFLITQLLVALCGTWLKTKGWNIIGAFVGITSQFLISGIFASLLSVVLARTSLPYQDNTLIIIDAFIFELDWRRIIKILNNIPFLVLILNYAYASLTYQPIILLTILLLKSRVEIAQSFCATWVLALLITVAIFPFVPALGGYLYYHIARHETHVLLEAAWQYVDVLSSARDGRLHALNENTIEGIITFPSFHAAAAILMIKGFWDIQGTRIISIFINCLMLISTIVIGGHYLIDMFAGVLIALCSIILVEYLMGWPMTAVPLAGEALGRSRNASPLPTVASH